jgi:hypothetical protein
MYQSSVKSGNGPFKSGNHDRTLTYLVFASASKSKIAVLKNVDMNKVSVRAVVY